MNIQELLGNVGTSTGPAFCVCKGIPYLAWKGEGTDQGIYWSKASSLTPDSNGRYSWPPQTHIGGIGTSAGPALASFGDNLYMAWKGMDSDSAIYFSKLDGNAWTPQQKLVAGTSAAPAMVGTDKGLYMAWKGENDSVGIFWFKSTDGKTWTAQAQVPGVGGTSDSPALTANGNTLYMAWKAEPGDNRLFWSKLDTGTDKWSAQQRITSGTTSGPALTSDSNNVVWLAWRAVHGDGIFYSKLENVDKNQWSPQVRRYGVATSDRPSLISPGKGDSGIMMAWKGGGSDPGIYYGTLLLPVPSSLTYVYPRTNAGRGSPSSMAIEAQLVINQDGSCAFSGTFWNEAVLKESWYIAAGLRDGIHGYVFTASGDIGPGTQPWDTKATSIAIAQNWAGIVVNSPAPSFSSLHAGDSDDLLGSIESVVKDIGVAIKDVIVAAGEALAKLGTEALGDQGTEPSAE